MCVLSWKYQMQGLLLPFWERSPNLGSPVTAHAPPNNTQGSKQAPYVIREWWQHIRESRLSRCPRNVMLSCRELSLRRARMTLTSLDRCFVWGQLANKYLCAWVTQAWDVFSLKHTSWDWEHPFRHPQKELIGSGQFGSGESLAVKEEKIWFSNVSE